MTIPHDLFDKIGDEVDDNGKRLTNARRWDMWIRMIQITVHDLFALLPYEKIVLEVEIEDWLGLRNCLGVIKTRDHNDCDFAHEGDTCDTIYEMIIPPSIHHDKFFIINRVKATKINFLRRIKVFFFCGGGLKDP